MKLARLIFLVAGVLGVIEIVPLYLEEAAMNRRFPPAITHPEYYYGFIGVTLAWQLAFLLISRDPLRYRQLMPIAVVEKLSYVVAMIVLGLMNRVASTTVVVGMLDLVWAVLFSLAYVRTRAETAVGGGAWGAGGQA